MSITRSKLNIAIGIATSGRPEMLCNVVGFLKNQTRRPDAVLICPAKPEDIAGVVESAGQLPVEIVRGETGLPHQRNAILRHSGADVILFMDDDFLLQHDYLAEVEALFLSHGEVAVATGLVLADGVRGPGFSFEQGLSELNKRPSADDRSIRATYGGYGCNMAIRMQPVRQYSVRFDETLPLYAWLEDIDFSRQLAPYGKIVKFSGMRGVHLGTKRAGRTSGLRLGYSQIVNPIYLARKGTISWSFALKYVRRNFLSNIGRSLRPEPWVDRRGRLKGNLIGLVDLSLGRATPARILAFR